MDPEEVFNEVCSSKIPWEENGVWNFRITTFISLDTKTKIKKGLLPYDQESILKL